jgi:tRNA modification GTPase
MLRASLKTHPEPNTGDAPATIVAEATPSGHAGISVVRLSGASALAIAQGVVGRISKPRHAYFRSFKTSKGTVFDQGVVLYFRSPNSFTGEDVVEFQGHGGPIVVSTLIQTCVEMGARMARPGEFSERAFLNDKMDLVQLEGVADLIASASEQAAKSALGSLTGIFSKAVNALVTSVIELRIYIEASIDFPEEEIDFLAEPFVLERTTLIEAQLRQILKQAEQGRRLQVGFSIALVGSPNAGKSSVLNRFSGQDSAIVTAIPGTTRDVIREQLLLDGYPIQIADTAGIREATDAIEQEGIARSRQTALMADLSLWIIDVTALDMTPLSLSRSMLEQQLVSAEAVLFKDQATRKRLVVLNKLDLLPESTQRALVDLLAADSDTFTVSAKTGLGWDHLLSGIKRMVGVGDDSESLFSARTRHIVALSEAAHYLAQAKKSLMAGLPGELMAEDLKQVQVALGEITGQVTSDDLLGKIFSSFCIGK